MGPLCPCPHSKKPMKKYKRQGDSESCLEQRVRWELSVDHGLSRQSMTGVD
ncbi:unnamed protein product [Staurois parvus]|uniref:Uncharacterized protein n=1 Tax=Staurois parvus TaxID=386267 RepID=A0ABN9BX83_9NEOB|nr:unnamed protein product [Staurois parvus]